MIVAILVAVTYELVSAVGSLSAIDDRPVCSKLFIDEVFPFIARKAVSFKEARPAIVIEVGLKRIWYVHIACTALI